MSKTNLRNINKEQFQTIINLKKHQQNLNQSVSINCSKISDAESISNRLMKNLNSLNQFNKSLKNSRQNQYKNSRQKSYQNSRQKSYKNAIRLQSQETDKNLSRTKLLNNAVQKLRNQRQDSKQQKNTITKNKLNRLEFMLKDIKKCHQNSTKAVCIYRNNNWKQTIQNNKQKSPSDQQQMQIFKKQLNTVHQQLEDLRKTNRMLLQLSRSKLSNGTNPITFKRQTKQHSIKNNKSIQKSSSKKYKINIPEFNHQTPSPIYSYRQYSNSRFTKKVESNTVQPCYVCGCICKGRISRLL